MINTRIILSYHHPRCSENPLYLRGNVDFDVLNDSNPLKPIFEDLGGTWSEIEKDWKLVKDEIDIKRPQLSTQDLKQNIDAIFDATGEKIIPKQKITEIQNALKKASAWSEAKQIGKAFIPSGDATLAFERLQLAFTEKGLLILEVGELVGFVRSVGNHGPKWVNAVLGKNLKTDKELESARQFVLKLI